MHLRNLLYAEGVNPISFSIVLPLFTLMLFDNMLFTSVFTYLPKLVKSFGISEVDAGSKVGLIGSAVFAGRILLSFFWGYFADHYGKKKVLLISSTSSAIVSLVYGFSYNVTWAALTRFIQGITMGVIVICKAMMLEHCDDTNASLGMSFIVAASSVGMIFGSAFGGFFAFPGELYPGVFSKDSIFSQFKILLPSTIVSLGLLLGAVLTIVFIPQDTISNSHKATLIDDRAAKEINNEKLVFSTHEKKTRNSGKILSAIKKTKLGKLLGNKNCMLSCFLYMFYSMTGVGFGEIYPLYAATSREYHGFAFSTSNIGTTFILVSIVIIFLQFVAVPKIVKQFKPRKCFLISCVVQCIFFPLVPICHLIENRYLFWITQLTVVCTIRLFMFITVLCCSLLVNNSVERADAASANGLSVTLQTIGRSILISAFGGMYSWSLTNVKSVPENHHALGFPFDEHFLFLLLSIFVICIGFMSLVLPESLNRKLVVRS